MTSICPPSIPKTCQPLFAAMDALTARWQALAPASCCLALLDLDLLRPLIEDAAPLEFLTTLLSPAEHAIFQRFSYAKRRLEWLGGRLAAKHCLHRLCGGEASSLCSYREYSLLPDAHGRPKLEQPMVGCPTGSVSISHSKGYAAALACRAGDCGIDVQEITPRLATVQERFATEEELELIDPTVAPLTRLGLLWVTKEAVKKCLLADHPSFFGAIRLDEVRFAPDRGCWVARCRLTQPVVRTATVRIGDLGKHLIACVTGDADA